jgi:hypothetical protein
VLRFVAGFPEERMRSWVLGMMLADFESRVADEFDDNGSLIIPCDWAERRAERLHGSAD